MMSADDDMWGTVAPSLNDHLTIEGLLGHESTSAALYSTAAATQPSATQTMSAAVTSDTEMSLGAVVSSHQSLHTPPYYAPEPDTAAFNFPSTSAASGELNLRTMNIQIDINELSQLARIRLKEYCIATRILPLCNDRICVRK